MGCLGDRRSRTWWAQQRSMRLLPVVMRSVCGKHPAEVLLPEDQRPVGEFGADGQDEVFGEAVRARTPGWDLDHLDTRIGRHRVERGRELSGPIADEEPEPPGVFAEVITRLGACWVVQDRSGCPVTRRTCR